MVKAREENFSKGYFCWLDRKYIVDGKGCKQRCKYLSNALLPTDGDIQQNWNSWMRRKKRI